MIFIAYPFAALVPAVLFLALARRTAAPRAAAALWTAYAFYEQMMHARVWCSGECNIRVDLLLLYPLLLVVSVWAVISAFRTPRRSDPGS